MKLKWIACLFAISHLDSYSHSFGRSAARIWNALSGRFNPMKLGKTEIKTNCGEKSFHSLLTLSDDVAQIFCHSLSPRWMNPFALPEFNYIAAENFNERIFCVLFQYSTFRAYISATQIQNANRAVTLNPSPKCTQRMGHTFGISVNPHTPCTSYYLRIRLKLWLLLLLSQWRTERHCMHIAIMMNKTADGETIPMSASKARARIARSLHVWISVFVCAHCEPHDTDTMWNVAQVCAGHIYWHTFVWVPFDNNETVRQKFGTKRWLLLPIWIIALDAFVACSTIETLTILIRRNGNANFTWNSISKIILRKKFRWELELGK